jgi:hypothetical protein
VDKVQELFPLVVMDVYVQLPGKAGLGTLNMGSTASSGLAAPATPAGLRRMPTDSSGNSFGGASVPGTPANTVAGSGLLGVDLQQIVGAFSCESDRPPPNVDFALTDWEHFYALHQHRIGAHQQQSHSGHARSPSTANLYDLFASSDATPGMAEQGTPLGRSAGSSKANSSANSFAGSAASSKGAWTPTSSDSGIHVFSLLLCCRGCTLMSRTFASRLGVSTYLAMLPSGLQYQCHMLGAAPSKAHLERVLPRKVKEWLGLPV